MSQFDSKSKRLSAGMAHRPMNVENQEPEDTHSIEGLEFSEFMIWVDGVGGFRACTSVENTIGQAVPSSKASIPITGDIRQSHAKIQSVDGGHLLHPIGPIEIGGKPIQEAVALVDDRTFELGDSVSLRYRKPHAFSTTAVIDFESRHRTYPWSDAVLIVGNTVLLGPSQANHIFCPRWTTNVILIRRDGNWFCRSSGPLVVDGKATAGEAALKIDSRVEGDDFSFSMEAVG